MKIVNAAKLFYKFAVSDYPEWIPQFHKKWLENIPEIKKHPLLKEFRYELSPEIRDKVAGDSLKEYEKVFIEAIKDAFDKFIESPKMQKHKKLIAVANSFIFGSTIFKTKCIRDNMLESEIENVKVKLSKAYSTIHELCVRERIYIPQFDHLPGHQDWSMRSNDPKAYEKPEHIDIVFTTKYQDILGMSSRSTWDSCQDIRPKSKWVGEDEAFGTLGSCFSEYCGIIFLTDRSDYEGRGERMLYRSAVYLLKHLKEDSYGIIVSKIYPKFDPNASYVRQLFEEYLSKNLNLPIVPVNKSTPDAVGGYVERHVKDYGFIMEHERAKTPYMDTKIPKIITKDYIRDVVVKNGYYSFFRQEMLPTQEDYEEMYEYAVELDPGFIQWIDIKWEGWEQFIYKIVRKHPELIIKIISSMTYPGRLHIVLNAAKIAAQVNPNYQKYVDEVEKKLSKAGG